LLICKPLEQDKLILIYLTGRNWIWIPIRVIKGEEKPGQERMQKEISWNMKGWMPQAIGLDEMK